LAHATERIHIGSGVYNPLPQVNHPAKVAELMGTHVIPKIDTDPVHRTTTMRANA